MDNRREGGKSMKSWKTGIWLFGVNLYISTFTFGGGYIVIPMIRKIFVQQKQLFTESELLEMAAIAQSSPGAIAVNLSVLAGRRTLGLAGALISAGGAVLPSFITVSYTHLQSSASFPKITPRLLSLIL